MLKGARKLKTPMACCNGCWFTRNYLYEIPGFFFVPVFLVFLTVGFFVVVKILDGCLKSVLKLQVSQGMGIVKADRCQCNLAFLINSQV